MTPTRKPPTRTNPRTMLMYGPSKVGKTTATAALSDTFILELEVGNADYVEAWKEDIHDMDTLVKWCGAAQKERDAGRKIRGVVDTIDELEELCEGDATAQFKKRFPGSPLASVLEQPKGAGYRDLRVSLNSAMDMIESAFHEVIYIAHRKEKLIGEEGKQVVSKDINLTGKCATIVCSRVNAIASLYRDKESNLIADFKTTEDVVCGSHCAHLKGKQIMLGAFDKTTGKTTFHWDEIYLPTVG